MKDLILKIVLSLCLLAAGQGVDVMALGGNEDFHEERSTQEEQLTIAELTALITAAKANMKRLILGGNFYPNENSVKEYNADLIRALLAYQQRVLNERKLTDNNMAAFLQEVLDAVNLLINSSTITDCNQIEDIPLRKMCEYNLVEREVSLNNLWIAGFRQVEKLQIDKDHRVRLMLRNVNLMFGKTSKLSLAF